MSKSKFFTTKTLVTLAMLTAMGYALSFLEFPIFPTAPFLKLDFTNVITLLAGYMTGIVGAFVVELIKQVLIFLTHSDTAGVGQIANLVMTMAFVIPPIVMYKYLKGKANVVVGMATGSVTQIIVALICNRYITFPLYMGEAASGAFASLWGYVLLFNLIKAVVISVITFLLYKRLSTLLNKLFPSNDAKNAEEDLQK